jgi:hypothetical protein
VEHVFEPSWVLFEVLHGGDNTADERWHSLAEEHCWNMLYGVRGAE